MRWVVLLVAAVTLTVAAPARGAITTIGSPLTGTPDTAAACTLDCTVVQNSGAQSPIQGVITRWRVKTGVTVTPMRLQVLNGILATTGETVTPPPNATTTFIARMPIEAGNPIALACCAGGALIVAGGAGHITSSNRRCP